jgi:hypothetical protein
VPSGAGPIGAAGCGHAPVHPRGRRQRERGDAEHGLVTRRLPRTLRRIERDLAGSDPGLDALFRSFVRSIGGCDMSWVEKVGRKRFLLFGPRRRQRTLTERIKGWCAENWTDP